MLNIKVGDKLFMNWGAMYPTNEASIIRIEDNIAFYVNLYGDLTTVNIHHIKKYGERSVNGSPIGTFLLD